MNSRLTNLKNLGTLFTAAASLFLAATSSHALSVNLAPTDFSLSSDTPSGQANAVGASNAINQAIGPNGFSNISAGDVFSSDFLLLGATTSATDILSDGVNSNNSSAESTIFPISATDVSDGIVINFKWAFNGNATGGFSDSDTYFVRLQNDDVASQFVDAIGKTAPGEYGSGTESVNINTTGLTAGNYYLQITLNENVNSNSSAAGFNQITLENPSVSVPFEFSPSLGLMIMGGIFITTRYAKSRKAKQDLLNI